MTTGDWRPLLLAAAAWAAQAHAEEPITVTATKVAEPSDELPLVVTSVRGDDLRARGANDLRGALAGFGGVEVNPGGDQGPAGTVVSLQGLAEVDAYLLVVDGVPYGGAFNPATASFDPIDVERIEVLDGSAPVAYGATSFVGVIHAIRLSPFRSAKGTFPSVPNLGHCALGNPIPRLSEGRNFLRDNGDLNARYFSGYLQE